MSKHNDHDFDDIGDEVEKFLHEQHSRDEEKPKTPGTGKIPAEDANLPYSAEYEEIKAALEKVFEMCDKSGFSIQVALSDEPNDGKGHRITLCGHMTPENEPCEMIAAAAVYQAHHLFSHMVLAMAHAGAPLVNPIDSDEEENGNPS